MAAILHMELILISDNKLKIMLTEEDMFKYEICAESIDYDNTETRRAFWQILDEAKHRTGFDAASERVFIQVYPSRGGGCEMYVTKLGEASPINDGGTRRPLVSHGGEQAKIRGRTVLFIFRSFNALAAVCSRLREMGYSDESAAYCARDGDGYFLTLTEHMPTVLSKRTSVGEYSFIEEYGKRRLGVLEAAYIKEHCICIEARDAVGVLSELN